MVGYSAHNPKEQNFVQDVFVVAVGDTLFAIVAGFAIFAVTGYLSVESGVPLNELQLSGRGLAFQTYPVGLGQGIPYPGGNIMCALFFLTLYMLGFSTNVGLVESTCLILYSSKFWKDRKLKKWHSYLIICCIIFVWSFIDATDMALHVLDCTDEFVATFSFLFLGGAEAIAGGWFSAWDLYLAKSGTAAVYTHLATYVLGCCLGPILGFALSAKHGNIIGPVVGGVFIVAGLGIAWGLSKNTDAEGNRISACDRFYYLTFYNIQQLRQLFNQTSCRNSCWKVPTVWCFAIKYLVPLASSILFFQGVTNPYFTYKLPTEPGDGKPVYPWWVFFLANIGSYALIVGVIIFFFAPSWMEWLLPEVNSEFNWPDNKIEDDKLSEIGSQLMAKVDSTLQEDAPTSQEQTPTPAPDQALDLD